MILLTAVDCDRELNIPRRTVHYWMDQRMLRVYVERGVQKVERREVIALRKKRAHRVRRAARP